MEEDDVFDFDDLVYEGVDLDEDQPVQGEFVKVKSLILLAVFVLPTLLIVIEVLTGGISGAISPGRGEPVLTPDQFPSVHF